MAHEPHLVLGMWIAAFSEGLEGRAVGGLVASFLGGSSISLSLRACQTRTLRAGDYRVVFFVLVVAIGFPQSQPEQGAGSKFGVLLGSFLFSVAYTSA